MWHQIKMRRQLTGTVLQGKQKGMGIGMDAYEQMGRELFEKVRDAPILRLVWAVSEDALWHR